MPGKDVVSFPDEGGPLKVEVFPKRKQKVYFTDQTPEFTLRLRNISDKTVKGQIVWFLGRGVGKIDTVSDEREDIRISPGEEEQFSLQAPLLSYQSSGVIGIRESSINHETESEIELSRPVALGDGPVLDGLCPLYSFTIWDRDFYRANHKYPRYAQYLSALLAVLIVLTGVIQILML